MCIQTSGSDPLVFLRPSGSEKIQPTELASIDAGHEKTQRVGGKQAEPGVSSGFFIKGVFYKGGRRDFRGGVFENDTSKTGNKTQTDLESKEEVVFPGWHF